MLQDLVSLEVFGTGGKTNNYYRYTCPHTGIAWVFAFKVIPQRAKKVVSDSSGLADFAIGLVNSVLNLPDGRANIFLRIKITNVL